MKGNPHVVVTPKTSHHTLEQLSDTKDVPTAIILVEHPNSSLQVLKNLVYNFVFTKNNGVLMRKIMLHPNMSVDLFLQNTTEFKDWPVEWIENVLTPT